MRLARSLIALAPAAAAQETTFPSTTSLYYVVFLRPDPARKPLTKEEGDRIQNAHMANIQKMADDGLLAAAGPFENDPPAVSGVFVMKVESSEEARRIAGEDPTVKQRRSTIDVHAWRAPAGIGDEYFRLHKERRKRRKYGRSSADDPDARPARFDVAPEQRAAPLANHVLYIENFIARANWPRRATWSMTRIGSASRSSTAFRSRRRGS